MSSMSGSLSIATSDDETVMSPLQFTPPPMAPLPPPPPFSRTAMGSNSNGIQREVSFANFSSDPMGDGQRAYKYACSLIPDSLENYTCVSYQRMVEPIIQTGPQCGLVALAMANSLLQKGVTVDKLSEASQKKGYSKQGEIFSSANLETLSAEAYGCKTSTLDIRDVGGKWEFLNCLARGDLLLVPYDPDKNYVPILKKGHKAHWALVTGFFAAIPDADIMDRLPRSSLKKDATTSNLYHCDSAPLPPNTTRVLPEQPNVTPRALSASVPLRNPVSVPNRSVSARVLPCEPKLNTSQKSSAAADNPKLSHSVGKLSHEIDSKTVTPKNTSSAGSSHKNPLEAASYILVYAKQGHSKHTGIWNAKTLVESCCNLIEVHPERAADEENYAFPEKGIAEELCGKVVVLHIQK